MKKVYLSILLTISALTLIACGDDNGIPWDLDENSETPLTDITEIPEYEGLSFLNDGIGEVELFACRDGDTADFKEGDEIFRVRFLGLDTPESGHIYEPWGLPASNFACDLMQNASSIVLEAENTGERGNFGRYLGYVWVDGRLLNLELIERGYSPAQGVGNLKYAEEMTHANTMASEAVLGIHGRENDDTFPYNTEVRDITIKELLTDENNEDYYLHRFNVEGVVTANISRHVFIQDEETNHAIFLFGHYNNYDDRRLAIGNRVRLNGAQFYYDGKPYHSFFLTDYDNITIEILEENVAFTKHSIPFDEITKEHTGLFVGYENLTITGFDTREMIMHVEDEDGNEMRLHQKGEDYMERSLWPRATRIDEWQSVDDYSLEIGDKININATISEHREHGFVLLLLGDDHFEVRTD